MLVVVSVARVVANATELLLTPQQTMYVFVPFFLAPVFSAHLLGAYA